MTSFLLFDGYSCNIEAKRHVSAFVIVLSWSEMIVMIGRHPRLTEVNIYVTMLFKVTNFFFRMCLAAGSLIGIVYNFCCNLICYIAVAFCRSRILTGTPKRIIARPALQKIVKQEGKRGGGICPPPLPNFRPRVTTHPCKFSDLAISAKKAFLEPPNHRTA